MPKPSRNNLAAINAMIGSIGIAHLPCGCPSCTDKPNLGKAARAPKQADKDNKDSKDSKDNKDDDNHRCHLDRDQGPVTKRSPSRARDQVGGASAHPIAPGRNEKVNNLLKADNVADVLNVFNTTTTTSDEKALATQIQNVAKDSKTYSEAKEKIMEVCDDDEIDLDATFGLLAKFRHERNLLTTAILLSNKEREKALLCIKRVDDLMYMLQNVSKRLKDTSNERLYDSLNEIIAEIHELGKSPSILYDELLDLKDEHLRLVDEHEDMHHQNAGFDSCHQKLHTNYEKLLASHTKLTQEHAETRKKASVANGLKNDITRLESMVEKAKDETINSKKEIEKLNAELAKVNALKHENTQLKKKLTMVNAQPVPEPTPVPVAVNPPASSQTVKKKKGKKGQASTTVAAAEDVVAPTLDPLSKTAQDRSKEEELCKLQTSHASLVREFEDVRKALGRLESLRRKAETARDEAEEKRQIEQATSRSWQDASKVHVEEKHALQKQLTSSHNLTIEMKGTINQLRENLMQLEVEIREQKDAYAQVKAELETRSRTPATSVSSQQVSVIGPETIRLLRKIKTETLQLIRDMDESTSYGTDLFTMLSMIQNSVRRVCHDIERDIEEIMGAKSAVDSTFSSEVTLPFRHADSNVDRQFSNSHLASISSYGFAEGLPPTTLSAVSSGSVSRPSVPPGFGDVTPNPTSFATTYARTNDSFTHNRPTFTPSSTASLINASPSSMPIGHLNSSPGPIGSRPGSNNHNTPSIANKNPYSGHAPPPIGTPAPTTAAAAPTSNKLGNGAVGVDWSMWSKTSK